MKGIIDRFEGNYAVIELDNLEMINVERKKIPQKAKEGDVIIINGNKIEVDKEESLKRFKEIKKLMEDLTE